MPSGIQYQDNRGTATQLDCCTLEGVCNYIENEWNNPYRTSAQIGYFHPAEKLSGIRKLIFNSANLFTANGMFGKDAYLENRYDRDGNRIMQTELWSANKYMNTSGVRVTAVPSMINGTPVGRRSVRSGRLVKMDEVDKNRFFLNSEMMAMTMNSQSATIIPHNPTTNAIDLILPESFGILASDDADCGCSPVCCGNGWRTIHAFDPITKRKEKMLWRTQPPVGKGGTNPYGKITFSTGPLAGKTGYRIYAVRAVGASSGINTTTLMPDDWGTPIELKVGTIFEVGTTTPVSQSGCLPCATPFREVITTQKIDNGIEEMTGAIWCIQKHRLDTIFYDQDSMHMEIRRGMVRATQEIMTTLLEGQRGILAGSGNPLADSTTTPYNGVGTEAGSIIPNQTDGLMTLIEKYGQKMDIFVPEGCDNVCLLSEFKQMIETLGNTTEGYVLVGSKYLFNYIDTMVKNRVNAVATPEVAKQLIFGSTMNDYLYDETPDTLLSGLGNGMTVDYTYLNLGGRRIPFFHDPELEMKYPGRLYLMKLSAVDFWYPEGGIEESWFFKSPSKMAGTLIPNITLKGVTYVMENGQMVPKALNDCPITFEYYLKAGAWYDTEAYPSTFVIDFHGIKDGAIVPISEVGCGCFSSSTNLYRNLITR